ncbi:MAG: primosomal protein N' [Corynebacterium sp.]|nr:primosomal protein N' [Corynebacterium sp.]
MKAASNVPVAKVLPLLKLAHLDREFEYLVPADQDEAAQPGVRVRIRFAGRLCDALLLERCETASHEGELAFFKSVISPEIVVPPHTYELISAIATRYAGTRSEVIRNAIPPRHAKAEAQQYSPFPIDELTDARGKLPSLGRFGHYQFGESFAQAVISGQGPRAVWQCLPDEPWGDSLARLAIHVLAADGGVLIIVPEQADIDYLAACFEKYLPNKWITTYTAKLGPQTRYRRYLQVIHGQARLVIGTRNACFLPVENLQLAVIMHDGDDNLVDRRAPYYHAREVVSTRAAQEDCALLIGGYARSTEAQLLVNSGWAHDLVPSRDTLRAHMPYIQAVADSDFALERDPLARQSRMPAIVFAAVREALATGKPALFQVPRKGYVPTVQCAQCRTPARCRHCNGPVGLNQKNQAYCHWCGKIETNFRCPECGSTQLRGVVLGAQRTAEEIGRAFHSTRIINSSADNIIAEFEPIPAIVVATPGAAPRVVGGYGAVVFLDTWAQLQWPDLRAEEDTLRNWMYTAALAARRGKVVVVADASLGPVQALIRWDPVGIAQYELEQRAEAGFPPATYVAAVDGASESLQTLVEAADWPAEVEVLGPVELPAGAPVPGGYDPNRYGPAQRLLLRAPLAMRKELAASLRKLRAAKAVRKDEIPLRVQLDPIHVG